jgi:phosphate transport system permease protein
VTTTTDSLRGTALPRWFAVAIAGIATAAAVLVERTTTMDGLVALSITAAAMYATLQTVWSFLVEGRRHAIDRLMGTLIYSSFIAAAAPLASLLWQVGNRGAAALNSYFLSHSMRSVSPAKPGGGIYHALVGTLEQVGLATLIAVPLGILTAVYLVEYGRTSRLGGWVSFFVDVMTGVPSIVAGLFIYTLWVLTFGFERSGFAASLALTILMLPVVIRSSEEMLRIVPNDLREASLALGIPKWRTIVRVVLPTAASGIVTGTILAVARVSGETAPLLLTTFLSQSINSNPFSGPQAGVPTFIWDQITSATPASLDRAWAGALTLIAVIMVFYGSARLIARYYAPKA